MQLYTTRLRNRGGEAKPVARLANFLNAIKFGKQISSTEVFDHIGLESGVGYTMNASAQRTALEILHFAKFV